MVERRCTVLYTLHHPSLFSMNILKIVMRVLLGVVLLLPILGALGVFPAPTADLYPPQAWAFMKALMDTGYIMPLIGVLCFVCLVLDIMGKTALAAILLTPFTANVILFHIFLDSTPIGALVPATLLLILNLFFLWTERRKYRELW